MPFCIRVTTRFFLLPFIQAQAAEPAGSRPARPRCTRVDEGPGRTQTCGGKLNLPREKLLRESTGAEQGAGGQVYVVMDFDASLDAITIVLSFLSQLIRCSKRHTASSRFR
jgi:hypothetical protein